MSRHRAALEGVAQWPARALVLVVLAVSGALALPFSLTSAPASAPVPAIPVASSCVPTAWTGPDGRTWHGCATAPPPAQLPPDPFDP